MTKDKYSKIGGADMLEKEEIPTAKLDLTKGGFRRGGGPCDQGPLSPEPKKGGSKVSFGTPPLLPHPRLAIIMK